MTVKEVKDIIEDLQQDRKNFLNLQEFFLGHSDTIDKKILAKEIADTLENEANLNVPIRNLCSSMIRKIDGEIERLNKLIDSTVVKI